MSALSQVPPMPQPARCLVVVDGNAVLVRPSSRSSQLSIHCAGEALTTMPHSLSAATCSVERRAAASRPTACTRTSAAPSRPRPAATVPASSLSLRASLSSPYVQLCELGADERRAQRHPTARDRPPHPARGPHPVLEGLQLDDGAFDLRQRHARQHSQHDERCVLSLARPSSAGAR